MNFPEQFRLAHPVLTSYPGEAFGAFQIPARCACGRSLNVIAVDGDENGWEHVSVSLSDYPTKQPSWPEMCMVKDLFWGKDECVVQFHPPDAEYVNNHPGVLHLWRAVKEPFPLPPKWMV